MWPIEEYGKGAGKSYGQPDPDTGETYYGRGFVQLTWRENYAKASKILSLYDTRDLEWHAWMALDSLIATRVLFAGAPRAGSPAGSWAIISTTRKMIRSMPGR